MWAQVRRIMLRSYVMTKSFSTKEEADEWGMNEANLQNIYNKDPNVRFIPYSSQSNKDHTQWSCDIHIQCLWENQSCEHEWENHIRKGIHGGTASEKVSIKDKDNYSDTSDTRSARCSKCGAWWGELGQESDPDLFIEHLCQIFDEVKRVLVDWGTLWINIDDSYAGSGGAGGDYNEGGLKEGQSKYHPPKTNVRSKSLIGIPARLQLAMIKAVGFVGVFQFGINRILCPNHVWIGLLMIMNLFISLPNNPNIILNNN